MTKFGCDKCGSEFDIDEPVNVVNVGKDLLYLCNECFCESLNHNRI